MNAVVHIETALRGQITYLKKSLCTTPFKVADITEDKQDRTLRLMLMSSSPGILDGDTYQLRIDVAMSCSLHLQTQSYQRLYHMKGGASQQLEVHLAPGSSFCFLPHPSVPHEASSFTTKNQFFLSGNCSLVFGEVITCGRKLNGEVFAFSKYHSITEVFFKQKLVTRENLLITPSTTNVNAIGQFEGYTHQASLICLNESVDIKSMTALVHDLLCLQPEITFGITAAHINGLIIRILGQKAEQLHGCLKKIWEIFQGLHSL